MGFTTSETRLGPCSQCGESVEQVATRGVFTGEIQMWQSPQHLAPCGRQCFGAGARGKDQIRAWRAGEFHSDDGCKTCGDLS